MNIGVAPLDLGSVTLPDWHPRAPDVTCVVRGAAIRHPDGVIVVDTGTADDHPLIADLYAPEVVPLVDALAAAGIDERDVVAIVNTHLHFDHCGQNRALPSVPVWVQRSEYDLVDAPRFTVPEWAHVDAPRLRLVDGDAELAAGVEIVATPGHTPGHQSVLVDDGDVVTVIAGQCCYDCTEFGSITPSPGDLHDPDDIATARASIARLHAVAPRVVHLSHDTTAWRPE